MRNRAFQDEPYFKGNHCIGCSPDHPNGLGIRSYWDGEEAVCTWQPRDDQTAGWPGVLYGGIVASLIDCHCTCAAIAAENASNSTDSANNWYASVSLKVEFLRPTPVDRPVHLRARFVDRTGRKAVMTCTVFSDGNECARGEVIAVKVPAQAGPAKQ